MNDFIAISSKLERKRSALGQSRDASLRARGGNMTFAAGLAIGLFVGTFTGIVIISLMVMSRVSGEREERMRD
jgi:hypothetical protein